MPCTARQSHYSQGRIQNGECQVISEAKEQPQLGFLGFWIFLAILALSAAYFGQADLGEKQSFTAESTPPRVIARASTSTPIEEPSSLASAGASSSEKAASAPLNPHRFEAADEAFKHRRDEQKAIEALTAYRSLTRANAKDTDAYWRLSMACYYNGIRVAKTDSEREKLYAEGRDAGLESIHLSKDKCAPCAFWTAINMALYGQTVGVFKMLFSLAEIKKYLQQSIDADPVYAYGGAYRLLGLIYQKIPGILGGSNSKAKDDFEKAIQMAPAEPLNYLFFARLLREELGDSERALAIATLGLKVPPPTPDRVEAVDALTDLREFIEKATQQP